MATDPWVEAIGGALGSSIAVSVTYPMLQVSTWQTLQHASNEDDEELQQLQKQYRFLPSPIREVLTFSKINGWPAMYGGLRCLVTATAISQGIYFFAYSALRTAVVAHQKAAMNRPREGGAAAAVVAPARTADIGVAGSLIVAGLAGAINAAITHPLWSVTTQMQSNSRSADPAVRSKGFITILKEKLHEGGLPGLWTGLPAALVMVGNPTIQFILYEWLIARLLDARRAAAVAAGKTGRAAKAVLSPLDAFVLSALAKLGATVVTYPMQLIKNRLQAANASTAEEARYAGMVDAIVKIIRNEGVPGLFKGMQVKMTQTVLSAALLMAIKEQVYGSTRKAINLLAAPK